MSRPDVARLLVIGNLSGGCLQSAATRHRVGDSHIQDSGVILRYYGTLSKGK
jgi:hypothetical protein